MTVQVGLLVPRSGLYPTIGFELQAGLRASLDASSQEYSLTVENIGYGERDNLIYGTCEKLLLQGHKIIAAYLNAPMAVPLQPLFEAADALLIVLDSGYHFPMHEGRLPNVVFLSLQGMLCCRMIAASAVQDGYHRLAFTSSYYDAGYRAPYAMSRPVEEGGDVILFHHITTLKRTEFTMDPLRTWLQAQDAASTAVLAAFCGDMSSDFLLHLSRFEHLPAALYAGPYMAEEKWLTQSVYPGIDFQACVPWDQTLPLPANEAFKARLHTQKPTLFSMLGYEAGLLVATVQEAAQHGAAAAAVLTARRFESPRGEIRIDVATQQSIAPVYKAVIGHDAASDRCSLAGIPQKMPDYEAQWALLQTDIEAFRGAAASNWLNAYPCIE